MTGTRVLRRASARDRPAARPEPAAEAGLLPLVVLVVLYCALGYLVESLAGLPGRMSNVWFETTFSVYPLLVLCGLPFALASHRWSIRDEAGQWIPGVAGWREAVRRPLAEFLPPRRLAWVAVSALLMPLFLNTYGSWKGMIPALHPFSLDRFLTDAELALHGGRLPWEYLQPLLGRPAVTRAVDVLYILWLPLNAGVLVWQGWSRRRGLRARFFLSYVLAYIVLGTGAAIALSAAGPCYYTEVTGQASPYAPLMSYLTALDAEQPLFAVRIQRTLWENYTAALGMPFVGISAMPSVHVAVAVLFAILGWRTRAWLGWLFTAYAVVVLVGSVHLGWHYAVDGYVSILGAIAIWGLAGAVEGRRSTPPRETGSRERREAR